MVTFPRGASIGRSTIFRQKLQKKLFSGNIISGVEIMIYE
jgi:hypothetical protein